MQQVKGKTYFQAVRHKNLRDLLSYCTSQYGDRPAFRYHSYPEGNEITKSYSEFSRDIEFIGTGLLQLGVHQKHIGIMGRNCYEWAVSHQAIVNGLGVSVPLDRQLPAIEVLNLCRRGHVKALIYHQQQQEIVEEMAGMDHPIELFICMQDLGNMTKEMKIDSRFTSFEQIRQLGSSTISKGDTHYRSLEIDPEKTHALIFRSGTGDSVKGVMLNHRCITHNIYAVQGTLYVPPGTRALSVLPLHHAFENTVGMYIINALGGCICFSDGLRKFKENLEQWQIEVMLGVPLIFDTSYRQVMKKISRQKKMKPFKLTLTLSRMLRAAGIDLRRKLFKQILAGFGGHLKLCICGAAAIDKQVAQFFNDIGIEFYCGYGLTETSPVISVCNSKANIYGSVGPPISDIEIAIDTKSDHQGAEGEILTRSESVMPGYYEDQAATKASIRKDGWFRTGDLGYIGKKDCLFITGRIKSMIVLQNGKKAFPEELEALLNQLTEVRESFVWGQQQADGSVDICARLVPDPSAASSELLRHEAQRAKWIQDEIKKINQNLPPYKEIRYVVFSNEALRRLEDHTLDRLQEQAAVNQLLNESKQPIRSLHGKWL